MGDHDLELEKVRLLSLALDLGFDGESAKKCLERLISRMGDESESTPAIIKLKAIEATPENFEEYGQVIGVSPDGKPFGPDDAQLELSRGIPRFYMMRLEGGSLRFSSITHHASVTQCLGSIEGHAWYLGVSKRSMVDSTETDSETEKLLVKARAGHSYVPPAIDDVRVFRVSGHKFLKLNVGTWHAGPLFKDESMTFYNLELSNTNVVDHTTHYFVKENGIKFSIDD